MNRVYLGFYSTSSSIIASKNAIVLRLLSTNGRLEDLAKKERKEGRKAT